MKTDTNNKIIAYIKEKEAVTAKELSDYIGISPRAIFKQLAKLLENGVLTKQGLPPRVFYSLSEKALTNQEVAFEKNIKNFINENYFLISPQGIIYEGIKGFNFWCQKNNLPIEKTAEEYIATLKKYQKFKIKGLISGLSKFKKTFTNVYVDEIYYLDFYSIERFGKTKLGSLLLYAKQSQNKQLIKRISEETKNKIDKVIKNNKIDAIGFIPPSINRKVQLMKELERLLAIKLPKIKIVKASADIIVPQKTLSKLTDRIENASKTIFIQEQNIYKNILLIDDAVGSGSTINETARKLREKKIVKEKIIGLALTGSFKGFDVISEV
jgi:DNA-binding transcriptional ArsR family regulator